MSRRLSTKAGQVHTSAAASTNSPPQARRPSPQRPSSASANSTPSRTTSAAARPTSGSERQARSRPLIEALEPWLRAKLEIVSQKGQLAEAIRYALSRWEGLSRFLDDGRDRTGLQRRRAGDPPPGAEPEERPVRRPRRRRPALGGAGLAGGDLQAQRRRAPGPTSPTCSPGWSTTAPTAASMSCCPGPTWLENNLHSAYAR